MRDTPLQGIPSSERCEELVQCVFNLSPLEVKVYQLLVKEGPMRADDVGKKINRDRSTAYRCLRHLMGCNICYKEKKFLDKGGYYYTYTADPPKEVKVKLEQSITDWNNKMKKAVEAFVNKFNE